MTYAVLGPGGIGGLVGGLLARAGHPVILVVREGTAAGYPTQIHVDSTVFGHFDASVRVTERLQQPVDVLLVTCKATHLDAAMAAARPSDIGKPLVVPLLNGLDHIVRLRAVYGAASVAPAMIRTESVRDAPGRIRHLGWHTHEARSGAASDFTPVDPIQLAVGGPRRADQERLAAELTAAGLGCQLGDEGQVVWQKAVTLAPNALATTAVGGPIGAVRRDPETLTHLREGIREVVAVAKALGHGLDGDRLMAHSEQLPDSMRPSMVRDLDAGRDVEIDNIAGPIIRHGRQLGVKVDSIEWLRDRAAERVSGCRR